MVKAGKILGILFVLAVIIGAGLAAFVRFYLTDERVMALVLPPVEKALGRKIAIGDIKVGLFSGITIKDFFIKEQDGNSNFASIGAFVLRYDLMPLIQKKLVVNEIRLESPLINIFRDKTSRFNYESLAILQSGPAPDKSAAAPAAGLPIALTVDQVKITGASLQFHDEMNQLPTLDAKADLDIGVKLDSSLASLDYKGSMQFTANAVHGTLKPRLDGKIDFDKSLLGVGMNIALDQEQFRLDGTVKEYTAAPAATIDLSSQALNIDNLLAIFAGIPPGPDSAEPAIPRNKKPTAPAASMPKGLTAQGTVKVGKALVKGLAINDFNLQYTLKEGIFSVTDLTAKAYGGKLASRADIDLNQPGLAYSGKIDLQSVQAQELGSALARKAFDLVSGTLATSASFAGAGTDWPTLRNVLTADGTFSLQEGGIKDTPVSVAVAALLGLPELKNFAYQDISGTFQVVRGGKVMLKTGLNSSVLKAQADGIVSLDGNLDLPLTLNLSPALSEKLGNRAGFTKYLANSQGETTLNLKLAGTVTKPKPTLDTAGAQEQVKEVVKQKALGKIGDILTGNKGTATDSNKTQEADPANSLIKGLFGR